jgi:hypothetical protein
LGRINALLEAGINSEIAPNIFVPETMRVLATTTNPQVPRMIAEYTSSFPNRYSTLAIGQDTYSVAPNRQILRQVQAQAIALDRLACSLSNQCGPEQFDSVMLCAEYSNCRPGITSEMVWRDVAAPYDLRAADAMFQELLELRRRDRH